MPELPEVETVRRGIEPHLIDRSIVDIEVRNKRLRYPVSEDIRKIVGDTIVSVERRAKYILIKTDQHQIIIHLGMTGTIHVLCAEFTPRKHDHIILKLDSGKALFYNDARRFGLFQVYSLDEHPAYLERLAPEPLSDQFSGKYFSEVIHASQRKIKVLLMDQAYVVGVGNIYANEALFSAGICPARIARSLSKKEVLTLYRYIRSILTEAILQGGTTIKDFTDPNGRSGYFAQSLKVYGRENELCPNKCGHKIIRTVIAQRSTFWCDKCQQ